LTSPVATESTSREGDLSRLLSILPGCIGAGCASKSDQATTRILATLASVDDDDFEKSATYPDWDPLLSGEVTLTQLFHYVRAHFESHEPQIRAAVAATGVR
jgi:hypothetical protein